MNLYFKLLELPVFSVEDVDVFYNNMNSSRSAISRLIKEGLAVKIRNNMYTCISGETKAPVASRFQIACKITPSAYISHHTAMEYYGITNQVIYEVYVSSESYFSDFSFDNFTYRYLSSNSQIGVYKPPFSGGIVVTDIERTVIDSIKDLDKVSGLEEVAENIQNIQHIQEKKMLKYLETYHNQFLYQKVGYLLWNSKEKLGLSDDFFAECKKQIGKSKRYLTHDHSNGYYDAMWQLIIPEWFDEQEEETLNVDI